MSLASPLWYNHSVVFRGGESKKSLGAATEGRVGWHVGTVLTAFAFRQNLRVSVFNSSPMLMWPSFDDISALMLSLLFLFPALRRFVSVYSGFLLTHHKLIFRHLR